MAVSAIHKRRHRHTADMPIRHNPHSQDTNKAQGEAECFIGIKAAC